MTRHDPTAIVSVIAEMDDARRCWATRLRAALGADATAAEATDIHDLVIVDRNKLGEMLGKWGLPPWPDTADPDGPWTRGSDLDCSGMAQAISSDMDALIAAAPVTPAELLASIVRGQEHAEPRRQPREPPTPRRPPMSSYPILPPATRVRIHNRLERTRDAVNELLTSARDNAAALDQAAEELDPESTDAIELRGAAEALLRIAAAARTDRDAIVARRNYWPTEAGTFGE